MIWMLEADLSGVCQEALDTLHGRQIPKCVAREMARMKPSRQQEMAEIMVICNDFTIPFARALLLTTHVNELNDTHSNHNVGRIIPKRDRIAMGNELKSLLSEIRSFRANYADDASCLIVAIGYVRSLLANPAVASFLSRHYPETEEQLRELMDNMDPDKLKSPQKPGGFVRFKI